MNGHHSPLTSFNSWSKKLKYYQGKWLESSRDIFMDCEGRNYIDISPWMLVESSGDSEFDFGMSTCCCAVRSDTINTGNGAGKAMMSQPPPSLSTSSAAGATLAEDDAVSCSSGWDGNDKIWKNFEDDHDSCSSSSPVDDDHDRQGNNEDEIIEQGTRYDSDSHCNYQEDDDDEDEDGEAVDQIRNPAGGVRKSNGFRLRKGGRRWPENPPAGGGERGVMMKQACCGRKQGDQRDTDRLFWESCLSS